MKHSASGAGPVDPGSPTIAGVSDPAPRGSALRGSAWTSAGFVIGQVLRFASNLILTRLLYPAAFGQMALVATLIQGLQMFSDVGIGPAIVQSPRGDDPRFLNTAWTLQAVRGFGLWGLSIAIAWPAAALYEQPELRTLVPAAGLFCVLAGFESTAVQAAQRWLRLERLVVLDLAAQALGALGTILFALAHRWLVGPAQPGAVWALIGGTLLGSLVRLVLSHTLLGGLRNRFLLEKEALRSLIHFGRWVFVSTLLTFFAGQLDRLLFGKMIPLDRLGVYGIAATLAAIPNQLVQRLASTILFPICAQMHQRDDAAQGIGPPRRLLLVVGGAMVSVLIASGKSFVNVVFDARYGDAGAMLQLLGAAVWFQILEATNGAVLLGQGRVAWHAADHAVKLLSLCAFIPTGFHLAGLEGALVGIAGADLLKYVASTVGVGRRGLVTVGGDVAVTALVASSSALGFWTAAALARGNSPLPLAFLASATVAGLPWIPFALRAFQMVRTRSVASARLG